MVDGVKRWRPGLKDPARELRLSRLLSAGVSLGLVLMALLFRDSPSLLNTGLEVMTYTYGALLGIFCLGRLTTSRGHDVANVAAILLGIGVVMVLKFRTSIAWPWYTVAGFLATFLGGALFSAPPGRLTSAASRSGDAPRQ
jgi:hypothetical protein